MSASKGRLDLVTNAAATGNSVIWPGGIGVFMAESAAWGGGSASLQFKGPNGTWIDAGTDTTLTANGGGVFELPPGEIRCAIAGGATGVYATAAHRGD
jgi:hypothetical protein